MSHQPELTTLPKLTTGMWISSVLRRAQADAVMATIISIGDQSHGSVLIAARALGGLTRLYTATMALDGSRAWIETTKTGLTDTEVTARVQHLRKRDADMWVIEIETDDPEPYLDGQLV